MASGRYVSDTPVSARVDRAWLIGYEAGRAERAERLAIVSLAISVFTLWRQRRIRSHWYLLPWAIIFSLVAFVVLGPIVLVVLFLSMMVRLSRDVIGYTRDHKAVHRTG